MMPVENPHYCCSVRFFIMASEQYTSPGMGKALIIFFILCALGPGPSTSAASKGPSPPATPQDTEPSSLPLHKSIGANELLLEADCRSHRYPWRGMAPTKLLTSLSILRHKLSHCKPFYVQISNNSVHPRSRKATSP